LLELLLAFTMHLNSEYDHQIVHPHLRYETASPFVHRSPLYVGAYRNSCRNPDLCESKISFYGAQELRRHKGWVELGLVTGYTLAPVLPFFRVGYDLTPNVRLFAAPIAENDYHNDRYNLKSVIGLEANLVRF